MTETDKPAAVIESEATSGQIDAWRDSNAEGFLGLPDDASRKIGDEDPDSAIAHVTDITSVKTTSYDKYLQGKHDGKVKSKEIRDGFIYYAIDKVLHVPFPDGTGAYVLVTERYKARLPDQKN